MSETTEDYIASALTIAFGERCPDFADGCAVCEAWKQYDDLNAEISRCHARLEIDHWFVLKDGELAREEIPYAKRIDMIDAVECRDCTIAELERHSAHPSPSQAKPMPEET